MNMFEETINETTRFSQAESLSNEIKNKLKG